MPKKIKPNQIGGTNDLNDIHLWGQDQSPPSSYKIQLGYLEIPKTITFDEKWLDTPYRFASFHDANQEAGRIFDGYVFRISASNDRPYWDAPSYLHQPRRLSNTDPQWYDVYAVKPVRDNPYSPEKIMKEPPKLNERTQYSMNELSKLKIVPGSQVKPTISQKTESQKTETQKTETQKTETQNINRSGVTK